ncbi:unnamed protein product [Candida verbasci]|uniref:Uncharacterized protein n=1 Tax=Candida verbasci TaxID=1227364 RepID=A0A9W4TUP4_9ASCO|nr:unnamed protein product [Candida verbasci]
MISRLGLLRKPISQNLYKSNVLLSSRFISSIHQTTHDEEQNILLNQRKNRPESPHLTIYQPQLTWIMSSFHRITGVAMAGGFYALTCTFAATSLLNIPFDSTSLIGAFTALPIALQYTVKAICAYPFVYHFGNGIRHLIWDMGKELTISGVYRTGYAVLGLTAIVGSYLAFFY